MSQFTDSHQQSRSNNIANSNQVKNWKMVVKLIEKENNKDVPRVKLGFLSLYHGTTL